MHAYTYNHNTANHNNNNNNNNTKHILRGWRNTVEVVLFDFLNSMKPYPSFTRISIH